MPSRVTPQMREFYRKIFHIGFGLSIAALIYLTEQGTALEVLMLGTLIGLIFTDALLRGYRVPVISSLVDRFERKEEIPGKGALFFVISCLFCVVFFPKDVVVAAVVTLSILDGTAAIAGHYFGRHRMFGNKTAEGTLAGMAVTFIFLLPLVPVSWAILAIVVAGAIELLSPLDDNLLIAPGVCIALTLAGML
jgi:dolichol kinase